MKTKKEQIAKLCVEFYFTNPANFFNLTACGKSLRYIAFFKDLDPKSWCKENIKDPRLEAFLANYPKKQPYPQVIYFKNHKLELVFLKDLNTLKNSYFKADLCVLKEFKKEFLPFLKTRALVFTKSPLSQADFKEHKSKEDKTLLLGHFSYLYEGTSKAYENAFFTPKLNQDIKSVAIIGAGIAGANLAFFLQAAGFDVSVYEQNPALGMGASGNRMGILSTLVLNPNSPLAKLGELSLKLAASFYERQLGLKPTGCFSHAYNELMQKRFLAQRKNPLFKISKNNKLAFIKQGSLVFPTRLVEALFQNSKLFLAHKLKSFSYENASFSLSFENSKTASCDALVLCTGAKGLKLMPSFPLSSVRGQTTLVKAFKKLSYPHSTAGYITPEYKGVQLLGATYERNSDDGFVRAKDDEENIAHFSKKRIEVVDSRVGFRAYSSDRCPIIGQYFDESFYKDTYKALHWGKKITKYESKALPLFYNTAYGSRGLSYSVLGASLISQLLQKEPVLLDVKDLYELCHPARFLIRKLKKDLV